MIANFSKAYAFAAYTSAVITLLLTSVLGVFFYYFLTVSYWYLLLFAVLIYCLSFFVIQFRVERFIYAQVKRIYEDVQLLDESTLSANKVTTDMETLTKEVDRYATN